MDSRLSAKIWGGGSKNDALELASGNDVEEGNGAGSGKGSEQTTITMTRGFEITELHEWSERDEERDGDGSGSESGVLGIRGGSNRFASVMYNEH